MEIVNEPYGINCNWDSEYLCKKCGALLYYNLVTKEVHCFNSRCQDYPAGIEIFSTNEADLTSIKQQLSNFENSLGQMIRTCDYDFLSRILLERRRRIVEKFLTSRFMRIEDFLLSNDILLFIKKYKSLGIRKDLTIKAIIQLHKQYYEYLQFVEDFKEGRYLLARIPPNTIFRLKYYDVIIGEIWSSYGQVNLQSKTDVDDFRYHEVIERLVKSKGTDVSADYAPFFERLWPLAVSFLYLVKRNKSTSVKYQYSVTPTDLANILSIIFSMKDNQLIDCPLMNLLLHFRIQPIRDKDFMDFINMLSGNNDKIPIFFRTNGSVILDRHTLLLFFILMHSQHLPSNVEISGLQRMALNKQEASSNFEKYLRDKLVDIGLFCLPPSTKIGGREYDIISFSETSKVILLVETKFKDPSPSSFSANTLIEQELTYDEYGLLPQVIKQQDRYDLVLKKPDLFKKTLGLKQDIQSYTLKACFVTKYTPLFSEYGNVHVMSDRKFIEQVSKWASNK